MASIHPDQKRGYQRNDSLSKTSLGGAMVVVGGTATVSVFTLLYGIATNEAMYVYLAMASLSCLIPFGTGIAIRKKFDVFEPINLVALALFFSTTLRSIYFSVQDSDRRDFLMMGLDFDRVAAGAPYFLLGVISLCAGYVLLNTRIRVEKFGFIRNYAVDRKRLTMVAGGTLVVALIGMVLYIQAFDISLTDGLLSESRKRVHEYVGEDGTTSYGVGGERYLADFAEHLLFLWSGVMLAGMLKVDRKNLLALVGLGLFCAILPILSSSRSTLLLLALQPIIIAHYYGKLRLSALIIALVMGISAIVIMGTLREVNQTGSERGNSVIDRTIGAGNGPDMVRTAAIIERVPEQMDYQWGYTYSAVVGIYIPRSMWPAKPPVSLGAFVKQEVFGEDGRLHGWPPGMIAEGWMNFGVLGVVLVMFLFGGALRIFYETVHPWLGVSFPLTILYAVSVWRLAFGAIGLNFALGLAQTLSYLLPILVMLVLIRASNRAARA